MVTAVLIFAALTAALEILILAKLSIPKRLRVLGYPTLITATMFALNLIIHFGTMTGSMTAIVAALASIVTVEIARWYWGYIEKNRYYPGKARFDVEQVK